jgi:hypothetical protein
MDKGVAVRDVPEESERTFRKPNGIDRRVSAVEGRVHALESAQRGDSQMLSSVHNAVGSPAASGAPATGLYALVGALDHKVTEQGTRIAWWEKARERAIGALWAAVPMAGLIGAMFWFFSGKKLEAFFGG